MRVAIREEPSEITEDQDQPGRLRRQLGRTRSLPGAPEEKAPGTNTPGPLQIWSSKGYKQLENLNDAILVLQLNVPFDCMYSVVYQKVQSSLGSMAMLL